MDLPGDLGNLGSPQEEQAAVLVDAWIKSLREGVVSPTAGCVPPMVLFLFNAGALGAARSRQLMFHMSSCSLCRTQEDAMRQELAAGPRRVFHLSYLLQASHQDSNKIRPVLEELKAWLISILQASAQIDRSLPVKPLPGAIVDAKGNKSGQTELGWDHAPVIDRQGRLRLRLTTSQPLPGFSLSLALRDMHTRLDLAPVPFSGQEVYIVGDCSCLNVPAGEIPRCFFQATIVPSETAEKWSRPRLIPGLQRILRDTADVVDVWDQTLATLGSLGEGWLDLLASEMSSRESLAQGLEVLNAVHAQILKFVKIWQSSNGEEPPYAKEFLAGIGEIIQATQQRRKKTIDSSSDATIVTSVPKQKKDVKKIDIE